MKRLIFVLLIVLGLIGLLVYGNFWWKDVNKPVSTNEDYQNFIIPKGHSASEIANKLKAEGLIRNAFAFKVYAQVTGKANEIQAGEFRLTPSFTLVQIVNQLTKGPVEVWVTVPEGLRREQVAERFINGLGKEGEQAATFRTEFLSATDGEEGYLFPDTYLFPKTASASAVVAKMSDTFDVKVSQFEDDIKNHSLTLNEIVTLASIIERETKTEDERSVVAGILLNRLNVGMGLQADATVQYVAGTRNCTGSIECNWWPNVTKEHLGIDSPYNTYMYTGLPPSPIANPGLSSLRAAIFPEETDYFYYLHEPNGQIHYAETLDEHNQNVRKYLRK